MTQNLFLFLPAVPLAGEASPPPAWQLADDDGMIASGIDDDWRTYRDAARVIGLVPASVCPVSFHTFPDLTPAQAAAAARLAAQGAALGDPASLHCVAGAGDPVPVATVTHDQMRAWTTWCADQGVTLHALVPAALLVPSGEGWTRAQLAGETVVRGPEHSFAADGDWAAAVLDGQAVSDVEPGVVNDRLLAWAQAVPLDLLTGTWRPARQWGIAPAMRRLLGRLALGLAIVTLAIPAVHYVRLHQAEGQADAAALATASKAGVSAPSASAAEAELDRRISAIGGPLALSVPASALLSAMRDVPGVRAERLAHSGDGTLSLTLAAPRTEDINRVLIALQNQGYRITAQPMTAADGLQKGMITVRAVP